MASTSHAHSSCECEAQIEEQLYKDIHSPSIWVLHAVSSPLSTAGIHHLWQTQTVFFPLKDTSCSAIQQTWITKGHCKVKCAIKFWMHITVYFPFIIIWIFIKSIRCFNVTVKWCYTLLHIQWQSLIIHLNPLSPCACSWLIISSAVLNIYDSHTSPLNFLLNLFNKFKFVKCQSSICGQVVRTYPSLALIHLTSYKTVFCIRC